MSVGAGASAGVGALAGGALGSLFGPRAALFASAAGLIAVPLWACTTALWRLAEIPAARPDLVDAAP
jgi:hypothetical protein